MSPHRPFPAAAGSTTRLRIGSEEHKRAFCESFIDTHRPFAVEDIAWPALDEASLARLRGLPFWREAVSTEALTARKVSAYAELESDPVLREAIALQGYEEARHAAILARLIQTYRLPVGPAEKVPLPTRIPWEFVRTGYGECFDSFFAFGLFEIAKRAGLFPAPLIDVFEPVIQEEARHILFFVNWVAYRRARMPVWRKPAFAARCSAALLLQIWGRVRTAMGMGDEGFTFNERDTVTGDLSLASFLRLCVQEHDRRMSLYDPRLLRPRLIPSVARTAQKVASLGRG